MPSANQAQHVMWEYKFFDEKTSEKDLKVAEEFLLADLEQGLYQEDTDARVVSIIVEDKKFLLVDHVKIGKWVFPMGKVQKGESYLLGLQREMYEELGIKIREAEDLKIKGIKPPINPNAHFHVFNVSRYDGTITNKEPKKHKSLKWVTVDQLVKMIEHNEVDIVTAKCLEQLKHN